MPSDRGSLQAAGLLLLSVCAAFGGAGAAAKLAVSVDTVCPSPRVWTGIIMMTQCLDVTVLKSGEGSVKPGARLRLDVPLVKGNRLFERAVPQFSKTMVDVGSVLSVTVRGACFQKAGATDYIVDPTCITPLRGVPADRKPK